MLQYFQEKKNVFSLPKKGNMPTVGIYIQMKKQSFYWRTFTDEC